MRRLIDINGNKLTVATETIGVNSGATLYFQPIFVITKEEAEVTLTLSSLAQNFYKIPKELSTNDKIKFLLDCITREESKNTDMHLLVTSFCNGEAKNGATLFTVSGDNLKPSVLSDDIGDEYQSTNSCL
ncbi:hypothetical protein [Legionella waltersii]|uniref:Dot/Icm secretion system substrate n=1 Tax=Legionella waltersii TaxID=66969 RepID=A0A0W1A5N1_9GAMM|nr:hypothetical protein [Legionella waltersii]KTD76645.1 hypothetical protein Lwal_2367 [Legionella waltersii]SNU94770.1 Dot/Icm secretion system substrate [Legionella waltersii]